MIIASAARWSNRSLCRLNATRELVRLRATGFEFFLIRALP